MSVEKGRGGERRREIASRLAAMLVELEGFEADLAVILPSTFQMAGITPPSGTCARCSAGSSPAGSPGKMVPPALD
jgi:hypothetical protein